MGLLLKALQRENTCPPMWVMRQAGRYLPEYRQLRQKTSSFLEMCYTPELATEVTLQPLRRFNLDAAILFSDILVIPDAMGIKVDFIEGTGPVLEKLTSPEELNNRVFEENNHIEKIYEAVTSIRRELDPSKDLIGFCGAPWTVALYILDEKPSKDCYVTRSWAYQHPEAFQMLLDKLVQASIVYLKGQVRAGVDVLQIFDSWAGAVPHDLFDIAVKEPLLKICTALKEAHPQTPIILFPKGIKQHQLLELMMANKNLFDGIGLDYGVDMRWATQELQPNIAIQGNLDPAVLLTTPEIVREKTQELLEVAAQQPGYIFNLGHGILPMTPIENMEALVETVKSYKPQAVAA